MPLYIVRWPGLRASLIKARSTDELVDMLDEDGDPSQCTWTEYRGPVWVDFHVSAEFHIDEKVKGRLRPEEVVVDDVSRVVEEPLVGSLGAWAESVAVLSRAILDTAFPNLGDVLASEAHPDVEILRQAVVDDLVEHEKAAASRGVTLSPELGIQPVRMRSFRRTAPRQFEEVAQTLLDDFCLGLAPLMPEADGLVRTAQVSFVMKGQRPVRATLGPGFALRASAEGLIDPAHRADAFPGRGSAPSPFELRRNTVVRWKIEGEDFQALRGLVRRRFGVDLTPEKS